MIVSVAFPLPAMLDKSKLAVAPAGSPVAARSTVLVKPLAGVTVTVNGVLPPAVTVAEGTEVDKPKSGGELAAGGTTLTSV